MKRILSIVLAFSLLLSMTSGVFAEEIDTEESSVTEMFAEESSEEDVLAGETSAEEMEEPLTEAEEGYSEEDILIDEESCSDESEPSDLCEALEETDTDASDVSVESAVMTLFDLTDAISISEARESVNGAVVTVNGVVTRKLDGYWYIQDTAAGIAVSTDAALKAGDVVCVTGTYSKVDGIDLITETECDVLATGDEAPAPVEASVKDIYDGKYQGMLVKVVGAKIVSMDTENITIRDDDEATVVQVVYSSELNRGIMKGAKVDVVTIATARAENYILRAANTEDITVSEVPLEITNETELDAIRNNMYANYILMNDIELENYWVPIGTAENPFYGSFNGNGHTISNFDIQCDLEYWYQYAGFIGYMIGEGSVENLTIVAKDGGSVKAKTQSGNTYVGGIVAYGTNIVIDNCYYDGVAESASYSGLIGGYVTGVIKNCTEITVYNESAVGGGIAGYLSGSLINCSTVAENSETSGVKTGLVYTFSGQLSDCWSDANVKESGLVKSASNIVAENSYFTGSVNGTVNDAGGFAGNVSGTSSFTDCYVAGDVTNKNSNTGLFAGYISGTASFTDCYAEGNVTGGGYTGGFAGYVTGNTTFSSCHSEGSTAGGDRTGGFAGYVYDATAKFYDCYSTSNVTAGAYAGGFVGQLYNGYNTLERCYSDNNVYSTGERVGGFVGGIDISYDSSRYFKITQCYSLSDVRGSNYVAGFAGYIYDYYSKGSITNCYALGGKIYSTGNSAGFAAYCSKTYGSGTVIKYCYANNDVAYIYANAFCRTYSDTSNLSRLYYNADINSHSTDTFAVGKSAEKLMNQATYLDWDFVDTWAINPAVNGGYPYLKALEDTVKEESVIDISTEEELSNIRYNPYGSYRLVNDIELSEPWIPIDKFYGTLDGNNHKISNLTMADREENIYNASGLFTLLELGSVVKNLTIEGEIVDTNTAACGILAATSYARVENCHVAGSISAPSAGGMFGYCYFIAKDCSADVAVNATADVAGGFAAVLYGNVFDCWAKGDVTGQKYVGGFAGRAGYGKFLDSYAQGNVSGVSDVAGFTGNQMYDGYYTGCYAAGDVSGTTSVGGFIGYTDVYMSLTDCCATGNITGNGNYVGGLVGYINDISAYIYNCGYEGSIYSSGSYVGGLIGYLTYSNSGRTLKIYKSYTKANVKGSQYVGGFAGYLYSYHGGVTIENCYSAEGKIVATSTDMAGFIGYLYSYYNDSGIIAITNCYSNNYTSASSGSAAFVCTVSGNGTKTFTRCYYNSDRTRLTDSYAAGKASELMKDSATYLDWDFAEVWATDSSKNDGYPYLRESVDAAGIGDEYILITNEQELINIRYNLTGKYKLANDIKLSYNWIPIGSGTKENTFDGILEGDGHTIYGFNVPCDEEYEFEYAGMFASIANNAIIRNLNIVCREDGGVATKNFGSTSKVAGGIVANNYGVIQNCSFVGTVTAESAKGGIAANNYNTIESCSVNADISGSGNTGGIAGYNAGRIVDSSFTGRLHDGGYTGGIVGNNANYVDNCCVEAADIVSGSYVGGIAGYATNKIYGCTVVGSTVEGTAGNAGGIVGRTSSGGDVYYCEAESCEVIGTENVGGIIGYQNSTAGNCSFTGRIEGTKHTGGVCGYLYMASASGCDVDANITGGQYTGGMVGLANMHTSSRTIISGGSVAGTVTGTTSVGGVIGYVYQYSTGYTQTVSGVSVNAIVTGTGNYVGGVVGDNRNAKVQDCTVNGSVVSQGSYAGGINGYTTYAVSNSSSAADVRGKDYVGGISGQTTSTTTQCHSSGSIIGSSNVGGLIGRNSAAVSYCYSLCDVSGANYVGGLVGYNSSTVQFTYSTGAVSGMENTGGLVGYNTNSVLNSYYNKEVSGQSDTGKGIPKSSFEMKQQMNYVSWDYETYWDRSDAMNMGYPYLRSVEPFIVGEQTVIEIYTQEDLEKVQYSLNESYILMNDIVLEGEHTPIGTYESRFNGTFDGNGYTISNVAVPSNSGAYVGFFTVIGAGATIKNLTIEIADDSNISAEGSNAIVGGLAGLNNGYITNCFVSGTVSSQYYAGGLVGLNLGTIDSCGTTGEVNGANHVGGLVGYNEMYIKASYSASDTSGTTSVGGLVGTNGGYITSSYAKGNVVGRGNSVGGFVGTNSGTIESSSSENNVNVTGIHAGGFVGYDSGTIKYCSTSSYVYGSQYVGGFVGVKASNSISNCYAAGNVNATSSYNGGFVGRIQSGATVTNCYSSSVISGYNSSRGGFCGSNSGTVTSCYFDSVVAGFTTTSGGTAKNTTAMYTAETYSGWDFDGIWKFDEEVYGYPYLYWQSELGQSPSVIPAVKLAITAPQTKISVGEAVELTAVLTPATSTDFVVWSSSDDATVKVTSKGVIIGMKAGTAVITATAGVAEAAVTITVLDEQAAGNIIRVNSVEDIYIPYGSSLANALEALPDTVSVVLNNATLISLPVTWNHITGTEYSFEGVIQLNDNITNTNGIKAAANVVVEDEVAAPSAVESVEEVNISVSYSTSFNDVYANLPEALTVNLVNGNTASLMVSWNSYAAPDFNPYKDGVYEVAGALILPTNGTIVNPNGVVANAVITVEPMPEVVRNIVGAVATGDIEVAYGTELTSVKAMLPSSAYAVLEGPVTQALEVTWTSDSTPVYNRYTPGTYTFTGTFLLPDTGKITNTSNIKTTVNVIVLPSTLDSKNLFVTDTVAEAGSIAEVAISVDADSKIAAASFCITFDNNVLTPVDYEIGEAVASSSVLVNLNYTDAETGARVVKVSFVNTEPLTDGGELIKIRYYVNSDAEDNSKTEISIVNAVATDIDEVPLPLTLIGGEITLLQILTGDVNGDGAVNIVDALKIMKYDVGFATLTEREALAADVDKNGSIDIFDAMKIQKYDIGLSDGFSD